MSRRSKVAQSVAPLTSPNSPAVERTEKIAAIVRYGMDGPGVPLDPAVGTRFARDFSAVRCSPSESTRLRTLVAPARAQIGSADDAREREADAFASKSAASANASCAAGTPRPNPAPNSTFASVRIHAGERASESARALGARAYTVGSDIVFAGGAYAPHTTAGQRLLAHELAHVMQQTAATANGTALVQRQTAPADEFTDDPLSAAGFRDNDTSIRVKPGPVRTTLIRPRASPMTTQDGTPFPGRQPDDGAWIQEFLTFFNLGQVASIGSGERYAFLLAKAPQRTLTLTQVVETVIEQGALDGHALDHSSILGAIGARLPAPPPAAPSTSRASFFLTFSVVRTAHLDTRSGRPSRPDTVGAQAAAQITWEIHLENKSGPELSWVGQLAAFRDTGGPNAQTSGPFQLQSAYTGFQAGWVFAFLAGSLQIEPILQALRGVARAQDVADGMLRLMPTTQLGAAGQLVYVIPSTGDHLQIGGQAAFAFTSPSRAQSTIDLAPSVFLQWKF